MNYQELVNKRKEYHLDESTGFINQSEIENGEYDSGEYLDPWGQWHNAVPARIGQDWGGKKYFLKNKGKDVDSNYTCSNLVKLFAEAGIDIGKPNSPGLNSRLHFANLISFIRVGPMQGNGDNIINDIFINKCIDEFIRPLINIVEPEIIITLGSFPFKGVLMAFDKTETVSSFTSLVENAPIELRPGLKLYPMFHCGAMGVNLNRKLEKQKMDWGKLAFLTN
jgi:uracil-DNA glycosylase